MIKAYFQYKLLGDISWNETSSQDIPLEEWPQYFEEAVTDLDIDTYYEYRSVIEDETGTKYYSEISTFSTLPHSLINECFIEIEFNGESFRNAKTELLSSLDLILGSNKKVSYFVDYDVVCEKEFLGYKLYHYIPTKTLEGLKIEFSMKDFIGSENNFDIYRSDLNVDTGNYILSQDLIAEDIVLDFDGEYFTYIDSSVINNKVYKYEIFDHDSGEIIEQSPIYYFYLVDFKIANLEIDIISYNKVEFGSLIQEIGDIPSLVLNSIQGSTLRGRLIKLGEASNINLYIDHKIKNSTNQFHREFIGNFNDKYIINQHFLLESGSYIIRLSGDFNLNGSNYTVYSNMIDYII